MIDSLLVGGGWNIACNVIVHAPSLEHQTRWDVADLTQAFVDLKSFF